MGGGIAGNFGNTKGALDAISDALAVASLVPGLDTFADLAAVPVDLARGDFVSAGLDAFGAVPFIGEIADTARLARTANKAADAVKAVDRTRDAAKAAKRSTKGTRLLNRATNQKLKNTISEMYRPGAKVGDGGLADAIRHEIKTGKLVGGKSHIKKGSERLKNLENILKKQKLDSADKKIVTELIDDLKKALEGK